MAKNVAIIGGGPAGYVAAIRAAQLGMQVALIEKDTLGGTCINRGCIPTKSLLESADLLVRIKNSAGFGISVEKVSVDYLAITKRKEAVVKQLVAGIASLIQKKKNQIRMIKGTGSLFDSTTVGILGEKDRIKVDSIIIATGSRPSTIPITGMNGPGIINSDEALSLKKIPESMIIIGGGVIGLEFAQIMHRMGSKVTVLEMMPQIIPKEDLEIATLLEGSLRKEGIEILTNAMVTNVGSTEEGEKVVSFTLKQEGEEQKKIAKKVLLAVGRSPYINDLGAGELGIRMDGARIAVNERLETSISNIYAVGDVIGNPMLAHVAMEEGKCAVENCLGAGRRVDFRTIPRCVYTSPEVASVGLREAEAREEYGGIKIGIFPLIANSRAMILNETKGIIKIIADAKYGQILGVHIIGPHATELIAEAVLSVKMEATFEYLASTIHAHPTLSEAMMEAALGVGGKAIHF
jgi:dihydrolipoamide dehydrogenase